LEVPGVYLVTDNFIEPAQVNPALVALFLFQPLLPSLVVESVPEQCRSTEQQYKTNSNSLSEHHSNLQSETFSFVQSRIRHKTLIGIYSSSNKRKHPE
jgi:hypothetical protein